MGSITGLKKGAFTSIDNSGEIRLGNNINPGVAGQALVSGGPNQPTRWDTHTGNIQPLTMGTDLSLASGNTTFDGSIPDTINAAGHGFGSGGNGIDISGTVISTDNDNVTISNSTGKNIVLKVPNDLTISQNGTIIDTFNGSTAKTIDLEGKYTAGCGIDISGHPIPHIEADTDEITITHNLAGAEQLSVLKVPNDLIFTGYATGTFNGLAPLNINLVDNDNQLNLLGGSGIIINNTGGFNRIITADIDNNTLGWTPPSPNKQIEVRKVPNTLTFTGYSTGTFDGSSALSINLVDTDTTYQGGTGITINTATNPDTINCSNIPNSALQNSTISGISLGNNLATLTFYDSKGAFITSYNGANPPTSLTLDGDTTYQGGTNININPFVTPQSINLDKALTGIDSITMTSTPTATSITGNTYPSNPTDCSYLDLSSTTNVIPGGVLATKIQRTSLFKSFSNVYSEYSSNFRTSFKAQSANVMVEFRAIVRADNIVFYGGLYDYNAGVYNTDCRNRFNYNDETDQDTTTMTWWMRNLTPGTTYYISPYFRGSASTVYIYSGHSGATDGFAPAIMRIYDGGNNVNIY